MDVLEIHCYTLYMFRDLKQPSEQSWKPLQDCLKSSKSELGRFGIANQRTRVSLSIHGYPGTAFNSQRLRQVPQDPPSSRRSLRPRKRRTTNSVRRILTQGRTRSAELSASPNFGTETEMQWHSIFKFCGKHRPIVRPCPHKLSVVH